jgi:hypothetical protein
MGSKHSIVILLYSIALALVVVGSAIDSHIHPMTENVRMSTVVFMSLSILGLLTYSALQSVEKRIAGLEEKFKKEN